MPPGAEQVFSRRTCPAPIDIIEFIANLNDERGSASRFGSFSGAVYDTAWLSMISKVDGGRTDLLFPQCFETLLDSQQDDGAWGATASQVDGILNSLAALLALATRQRSEFTDSLDSSSLDWRIERARSAIEGLLQHWDPSQSLHVGFEILVPSLLRQLSSFDIHFHFPGHSALMYLHNQKLRRFDPSLVCSTKPTTLLHSLEAFVGLVDFDQVGHHCSNFSGILGSPAATAAYLINAATWDDRAENYLRTVVTANGMRGTVPSAYPTCIFELSWALSTLLAPGLLPRQLTGPEEEKLRQLFENALDQQDGVVGFAPGILEDVDDTARALMTLQGLGKPANPARMVENFQTDSHFRTYKLEGSPSFSANCHVVLSLLGYSDLDGYEHHIERALTFLLGAEESGPISDKWNLSPQYCRMLFMQTLVAVLEKQDHSCLGSLPTSIVYERVPGSICRLLSQTVLAQRNDGSWADSLEITAYSILTIAHCLSLPWTVDLKVLLNESISRGRQYLHTAYGSTDKHDYLWVEKVSYRSSLLHATYCSTALNIKITERHWSTAIVECFSLQSGFKKQMGKLISSLPLFQESPLPSVDLVFIEAGLVARRLRKSRDALFSRDDIPMTADKYVDFIPMIWVACNHKSGHILSANIVWEMVLLSLFNFQVDEYMESVVASIPELELPLLLSSLKTKCYGGSTPATNAMMSDRDATGPVKKRKLDGETAITLQNGRTVHNAVAQALEALGRFIEHVTQHGSVLRSPSSIQREIARELYNFLVAHITHNQDNVLLAKSKASATEDSVRSVNNERTYIDWVRTTASDDTSCPFSFLFFTALISERGRNCFEGARAGYLSRSLCRHLATMCRQYNDYGSAKRDAEECNLNSLDFPEFQSSKSQVDGRSQTNGSDPATNGVNPSPIKPTDGDGNAAATTTKKASEANTASAKDDLMAIAEFERAGVTLALSSLTPLSSPVIMHKLRVFIDVTDMFGQIYVQRDIASRVQKASSSREDHQAAR
ncbi:MAG: hypothetical protein LQ346_003826 [Caloplaca aetnensis]|nr:MAG: hypothetical protein LQ346_003826 [Caloplaca aetnensis]